MDKIAMNSHLALESSELFARLKFSEWLDRDNGFAA